MEALVALESGAAPIDAETCRELVGLFGNERKEIGRRAAGALARAAADPECRSLLESALTDGDARRRWCACFALGRAGILGGPVIVAAIEALGFDDADVRWAAAAIVCRAVRSQPRLLEQVRAAARAALPEQRKMALYCLRDAAVVDEAEFLDSLHDHDRGVRMAALAGLSRCEPSKAAIESMATVMEQDADEGVRRAAAAALARRGGSDSTLRERIARAETESKGPASARSAKITPDRDPDR